MLPLEWRAMVHFLQHLDLIEQMSGGGGGRGKGDKTTK